MGEVLDGGVAGGVGEPPPLPEMCEVKVKYCVDLEENAAAERELDGCEIDTAIVECSVCDIWDDPGELLSCVPVENP